MQVPNGLGVMRVCDDAQRGDRNPWVSRRRQDGQDGRRSIEDQIWLMSGFRRGQELDGSAVGGGVDVDLAGRERTRSKTACPEWDPFPA